MFWFGPTYHVTPKKPGERYGVTEILASSSFKDFGEGQREDFVVPAMSIANDLTRDVEQHGLFSVEVLPPSEELLVEAEAKQRAFYEGLVTDADSIWARTQDPKQISFHARIAAATLGLRRDWASDLSRMTPCVACRELISIDAAKCPRCTAIVDWEKARDFGLVSADQERFAVKRGLLKSLAEPEASVKALEASVETLKKATK